MQPPCFCAVFTSDITASSIARSEKKIKKLATALAVLAIAGTFFSLGLWQLDRAQELSAHKKSPVAQDQRTYSLDNLTSPEGSLPVAAFGKRVTVIGHYIANYKAPNQISTDGTRSDWEVALMQVGTDSAILVVRGLWDQRFSSPEIVMASEVTITGTLQPSQYEDRAANTPSQLSRLDSALLTSTAQTQLYDGFIAVESESTRNGEVTRDRIAVALPKGDIPGYYWQHISYVVVWWFMAALVIWAPFYKRRDEHTFAS